jgi:hypothetical protein
MLRSAIIKMHRAQSSMEFFVFCGLAFVVAILFTLYAVDELKSMMIQQEYNLVRDLGIALQKETMIAASVEDGYVRHFEVPQQLHATLAFTIRTANTSVSVESAKAAFSASIPEIEGNFTKGSNRIEKRQGVVYVNP